MQTGPSTFRSLSRLRSWRLAAAVLPLPALLVPAPAHAGTSFVIAVCSSGVERMITIPARKSPTPGPDDRKACVHPVCPRERGHADADGDEE